MGGKTLANPAMNRELNAFERMIIRNNETSLYLWRKLTETHNDRMKRSMRSCVSASNVSGPVVSLLKPFYYFIVVAHLSGFY